MCPCIPICKVTFIRAILSSTTGQRRVQEDRVQARIYQKGGCPDFVSLQFSSGPYHRSRRWFHSNTRTSAGTSHGCIPYVTIRAIPKGHILLFACPGRLDFNHSDASRGHYISVHQASAASGFGSSSPLLLVPVSRGEVSNLTLPTPIQCV